MDKIELTYTIAAILFGASWGSFLNVVISRVPLNISIVYPPSRCPVCNNKIKPYDNIPILSYLILGGKCRNCKTHISIQYPVVELIGAIMGFVLYKQFDVTFEFLYYFVFVFGLIALCFIDLKTWLVPNSIVFILAGFGLFVPLVFFIIKRAFFINIKNSLIGGITGFVIVALIILIYKFVRKIDALGWGDAFVLGVIGIYLTFRGALYSLFFAVIQASIVGIILIILNKKSTVPYEDVKEDDPIKNKTALPFVPFLVLGALEYLFFGDKIINFYYNLMKL